MKLLVSAGVVVSVLAAAQNLAPERKSMPLVPQNGDPAMTASALSIEHGAEYPSIVILKGEVEIKASVCVRDQEGKRICDGYTILRADAATYHENTGDIEAEGKVTLTRSRK